MQLQTYLVADLKENLAVVMHCHLNAAILLTGILVLFSPLSRAYTYDPDYIIEDLYDRLAELQDQDGIGYPSDDPSDLELENNVDPRADWPDIPLDSRDLGQADLRDKEFLEQPAKWGYQYISGMYRSHTQLLSVG